jgi:hypothetical protein
MTQSYRSQLRRQVRQMRENISFLRANLCDGIDALQNDRSLRLAEAEVRHLKRQVAQSRRSGIFSPDTL